MTNMSNMAIGNPDIGSQSTENDLPKIQKVIGVHLVSLAITVFLGIILFLTQAPSTYFIIMIFLTGPIYAINLPYLFRYIKRIDKLVVREVRRLNRYTDRSPESERLDNYNEYKLISDIYTISRVLYELREERISERWFLILSLTPIWPILFYYGLYRISKKMKLIEYIQEEISRDGISQPDKISKIVKSDGEGLFKMGFRHDIFFLAFSIISIIGFALTFSLVGVGFFAPFWIVLLHNKLSEGSNLNSMSKGGNPSVKMKYITFTSIFSFLCFGATSGFIAAVSNTIYASIISPIGLISPTGFILFLVTVIAPLTEEPSKVAGFFLTDKEEAPKVPLFYWSFFGMVAGLGFALIEDYSYFQQFYGAYSTRDSLYLLLLRLSNPVHLIGGALGGIGVGLWRKKNDLIYLIIFIFLAMFIHGSYNFLVSIGGV